MEYTTLGDTGMTVSRLFLGSFSFGGGEEWMLDDAESATLIERAIDLGIDFFDTANMYSSGDSERIFGETIDGYGAERFVLVTKLYHPMDETNPHSGGLSRKAIEQELAHSRERLGVETIDLLQTRRWDDDTPIEETLRAFDDAVRRGHVRHIGGSSMWARQFADALHTSDQLGLERFATMQNHYNLAYREEEREMLPLCQNEGIGVIPWSPLARGFLARPHEDLDATTRGTGEDIVAERAGTYRAAGGVEINERVQELADEYGASMAQISVAWLLHKEWVDAPIVGTTSVEHLEEAVEAVDISLSSSDLAYLEEPYEPVPVSGHK